jgi:hypothetical protein
MSKTALRTPLKTVVTPHLLERPLSAGMIEVLSLA